VSADPSGSAHADGVESHSLGLRALVVDDDVDVRRALRLVLLQQPDIASVSLVDSVDNLLGQIEATAADVVLLDWDGCANDARDSVVLARRLRPDLAVIGLSTRPETRQHALASGATGFVSKGDPPERVLEAVRVHTRGING
jgi:DNA-binding NarL/FixJ family response regulator